MFRRGTWSSGLVLQGNSPGGRGSRGQATESGRTLGEVPLGRRGEWSPRIILLTCLPLNAVRRSLRALCCKMRFGGYSRVRF